MAIEYNLPTYLTLLRIALIPLMVLVFYLPWEFANLAGTAIFVFAAITDWLDGYLARKMNIETPFGAFLDPVADKLMVASALVIIVQQQASPYLAIPAVVIIGREITIASLREWMAEIGQRASVKVSHMAKWKTAVQMVAISLLLYGENLWGLPIHAMGYGLLYIAAFLTLWSMLKYLRAAFKVMS